MKIGIVAVFLIVVCLSGCGKAEVADSPPKAVSIVQVEGENCDVGIDYIGVVRPKETHNYAFLTGGKIEEIHVEKGDYVHAGDKLAKLDTTQLELSVSIGENSIEMAENTIKTLTESLNASELALETARINLERYQELYDENIISLAELENMKLQYAAEQANYTQLQNELSNAQVSVASSDLTQQQTVQNLKDATLIADKNGIVMELPYHENEVVGAGIPVVITKSQEMMVTVGVSVEEYNKI